MVDPKPQIRGGSVMTLTAHFIASELDVERLRYVRNRTAHGYSTHTEQISEAQQRAWWVENRDRVMGWLYRDEWRTLVGFGLLRQADDGYWLTVVGVLPEHGGRGYGKWITHDIVMRAPGKVRATARKDNPAAVKLHVPEDWRIVDGPDERLVYFEGRRDPDREEMEEHWAEHGWALDRPYQPWGFDPDRVEVTV